MFIFSNSHYFLVSDDMPGIFAGLLRSITKILVVLVITVVVIFITMMSGPALIKSAISSMFVSLRTEQQVITCKFHVKFIFVLIMKLN